MKKNILKENKWKSKDKGHSGVSNHTSAGSFCKTSTLSEEMKMFHDKYWSCTNAPD